MGLKAILLILSAVQICQASMECYYCKDALDPTACNTTTICNDGQVCFYNSTTTGQIKVINLGCADYQQCGIHGNIQSSIVGREIGTRNSGSCFECCSTDQCNKHLCDHLKPSACIDDESIDCAKLNTLFSICSDIHHAKTVCPKFCGLCNVVDGNWSGWSPWSHCDVTCENGTQTRTRLCANPAPKNGGQNCQGSNVTTKPCVREVCPVNGGWSTWEAWKSCSTTCDMGLQSRTRNCSNPFPAHNGHHCFGHNLDVRQCLPGPCANGGWSEWGNWSPCTVSCGIGIRSKSRSCTSPPPSPYGQYCIGDPLHLELCSNPECDVCLPSQCNRGTCIDRGTTFKCVCEPGVTGRFCDIIPASDCYDILKLNLGNRSGIYWVNTWKTHEYIEVLCDLETAGGGWTVFQRRFNGAVNFGRNFVNYTKGFGNKNGEFWLGLQYIYEMTSQGRSELRLDLMSADQTEVYEVFPDFHISSGPAYTLHIGRRVGTAGEGNFSYHNGQNFYTYDHDNSYSCASKYGNAGGWWFGHCAAVNLNGQYVTPGTIPQNGQAGIVYYDFQEYKSLKSARMMFRRT